MHVYLIILVVFYLLTWLLIPHLLLQKKRPVATLAWLFSIIFLPFFGPMLFLLIGPDRLRRKRLRKKKKFEGGGSRQIMESGIHSDHSVSALQGLGQDDAAFFHFLSTINELPVSSLSTHQLLYDAPSYYSKLIHSIQKAEHHVHVQVFIWQEDHYGKDLLNIIVAAAKRGVKVRILIDEIGSLHTSEKFFRPLVEAGGKFAWFSSLQFRKNRFFINLRNHRKIIIIDGIECYVGGMNIGKEYAGENPQLGRWFDMQIRFKGELASVLQQCFADDWYYAADERVEDNAYFPKHQAPAKYVAQVVASGPDSSRDPMHKSFLALMNMARKRIWITTGYFVPTKILLTALQMCAMRGIEIRLLVPLKLDYGFMKTVSRAFYDELLPYGIEIYETYDAVYHAKTMIVDEEFGMIGSSNFDTRSMLLNFELNVVIHSKDLNRELEIKLNEYFSKSTMVNAEGYNKRGFMQKLFEGAMLPLAPLL